MDFQVILTDQICFFEQNFCISSLDTIVTFLPVVVAYGAFFAMVYNTLKMFESKRVKVRFSV